MHRRHRLAALATAVVLAAGACGSGGGSSDGDVAVRAPLDQTDRVAPPAPPPPAEEAGPAPVAPSDLPDVTVLDVHTGDRVTLASLAPADRPILLWFWAPH